MHPSPCLGFIYASLCSPEKLLLVGTHTIADTMATAFAMNTKLCL